MYIAGGDSVCIALAFHCNLSLAEEDSSKQASYKTDLEYLEDNFQVGIYCSMYVHVKEMLAEY